MVICLERDASDLHMVQLMPLPPHHLLLHSNPDWFYSLMPAYAACPGNGMDMLNVTVILI